MCLILVAWRTRPDYPLVVAANRDEFFSRPTAEAEFWPDCEILAGRDLQAGGTWLGITRTGRFAALTNFRDPARQKNDLVSRGQLVAEFLNSDEEPLAWLHTVSTRVADYNGFNLLVSDGDTLASLGSVTGQLKVLEPGIYGLSNHLLDSPWPKVLAAKSALSKALTALPDDGPLFEMLRDDAIHPDHALPRTGVSLEWERLLSSAFVKAPGYGTRCSTVLTVGGNDVLVFDERTWLADASAGNRVRHRFKQSSP